MQAAKILFQRAQSLLHNHSVLVKAARFAAVGIVNTIVDFSVFAFGYFYLGLPILIANACSWTIAVSGSYVMNSYFTFAAESGRELRFKQYAGFVASQVGGLVANSATVFVGSYFMPVLTAKVLAIGVTFAVNFSLSHFAVFRPRSPSPDES
jgi:putative flippase GtrA